MLRIQVFTPYTLSIRIADHTEIWLNPQPDNKSHCASVVALVSAGQHAAAAETFLQSVTGKHQVICAQGVTAAFKAISPLGLGIGGTVTSEWGTLALVGATGNSHLPDGRYVGPSNGFVINAAGHKLYWAGDTGISSEIRFIGDFYKPNVAILPIDNHNGICLAHLPRVMGWLGSDILIPSPVADHIDPDELRETVDAYTSAFCKLLSPGLTWELPEALSSGRTSGPESRY